MAIEPALNLHVCMVVSYFVEVLGIPPDYV